jgi:O-antigen ligase/tetratricopeptide (TPR) repeat protein
VVIHYVRLFVGGCLFVDTADSGRIPTKANGFTSTSNSCLSEMGVSPWGTKSSLMSAKVHHTRSQIQHLLKLPAQLVLLTCLLLAPWIYGGVQLPIQSLLAMAILVAGILCCASMFYCESMSERTAGLLPFVPFLMVLGISLIHSAPTPWQSRYPAATRVEIARLVMGVAVFATAAILFRTANSRSALWVFIAINGAVLAFLGIAQKLQPAAGVFNYVPTHSGSPFASFVNKNSASGYLNLCVAAGLGMLIWSRSRANMKGLTQHSHSSKSSSIFHGSDATQLLALFLIVTCVAGIFCSMSRGGCIATIGAGIITGLSVPRSSRLKVGLVCVFVGLMSFALIFWSGLIPQVESRLATLSGEEITQNKRWTHWSDALHATSQSWLTGTGLGTYRYAYLPFQSSSWDVWFHHAENQYLETLVECGVIGLIILFACIILIAYQLRQLFRRDDAGSSADIRTAGLFALCSMCIQSLVDFPLVIPSNMLLFAVICGAVVGTYASGLSTTQLKPWHLAIICPGKWITTWAIVLFIGYGLGGVHELQAAAEVNTAIAEIPTMLSAVPDADEVDQKLTSIDAHIRSLSQLTIENGDNAELHQQIAELWLARYQLQAFQQTIGSDRRSKDQRPTPAEIWKLTTPFAISATADKARLAGRSDVLGVLRSDPLVTQNLVAAAHHLQLARHSCSILPRVNLDLAMLAFIGDESQSDVDYLERELRLSSANADVLYSVGLRAYSAGSTNLANKAWNRSISLNSTHLHHVIDFLTAEAAGIDAIVLALPQSPQILVELAANRFSDEKFTDTRLALLNRSRNLLDAVPEQARNTDWYRQYGKLHATAQDSEAAFAAYRDAIRLAPYQMEIRLEFSLLLQQYGRVEEAREEARVCAKLDPDSADVKTLIRELIRSEIRGADNG